jgi:hypothetical protein
VNKQVAKSFTLALGYTDVDLAALGIDEASLSCHFSIRWTASGRVSRHKWMQPKTRSPAPPTTSPSSP